MLSTQSSAPEDGRNCRPIHDELIEIINKMIIVASSWLFILVTAVYLCALLFIVYSCSYNAVFIELYYISIKITLYID